MKEMWQICSRAPNYEVSTFGRVRHKDTKRLRKLQYNKKGYTSFGAYLPHKTKKHCSRVFLHRAVAEAFIPNPNNLPEVNHLDGNPRNNNVNNLEWASHRENLVHSVVILGNNRKIDDELVTKIQQEYIPYSRRGSGHNMEDLAEKYQVNPTTIHQILNNRRCFTDKKCTRPKLTEEEMWEIVNNYTPHSIRLILESKNMSVQTFYKWVLPKLGLTVSQLKERYYRKIYGEIEERKQRGELYKDMFKEYGLTYRKYYFIKNYVEKS